MLHTKFQAADLGKEELGIEKKIFKYVLLANPGSPGTGSF